MAEQKVHQAFINKFGEQGSITITQGIEVLKPEDIGYDRAFEDYYANPEDVVKITHHCQGRVNEQYMTRDEAELLCENLDTFLAMTK